MDLVPPHQVDFVRCELTGAVHACQRLFAKSVSFGISKLHRRAQESSRSSLS